jgi:hypothetical protein
MSADTIAQARATGAALLAEARAAGVHLSLLGRDRIIWECVGDPSANLLARIRAAKLDVLEALRAEDWTGPRSLLDADPTRAAPAPQASSAPGAGCAECGGPPVADLAAFLGGDGNAVHVWRHRECWAAFDRRNQGAAP